MTKKLTVGIYGGTFSPIHFGHLSLAIEILERQNLDEVWFCPTRMNPLRIEEPLPSPVHRLKMVELAIADIPQFRALDLECRREGPSYTVDTVRELSASYGHQFRLLLGSDALETFYRWREPEEIVRLAPPLVGQRGVLRMPIDDIQGRAEVVNALSAGWVSLPIIEISSTLVRERLRQRLYCGHLVPGKVLDYIRQHHLY